MTTPLSYSSEPHYGADPEERPTREAAGHDPGMDAAGPARIDREGGPCRCGHDAQQHSHYRPGRDCGVCGAARCGRYRPWSRWRWWIGR